MPVLHSGLTNEQSSNIERVQKSSLAAILGSRYDSYHSALEKTKLQSCLRFITKNLASQNPLLTRNSKSYQTRSNENLANEFQCRTKKLMTAVCHF